MLWAVCTLHHQDYHDVDDAVDDDDVHDDDGGVGVNDDGEPKCTQTTRAHRGLAQVETLRVGLCGNRQWTLSGRSVDVQWTLQWTLQWMLSFYEGFAFRQKKINIIFFFFLTTRKNLVKTERPLSVHCSVH